MQIKLEPNRSRGGCVGWQVGCGSVLFRFWGICSEWQETMRSTSICIRL